MAKIEKFEDLEIWQEGVKLSVNLYNLLKSSKEFSLRDQLQRAAVSIPANIAEGFDRDSNKEFIRFLNIAKASCSELRTHLYIAIEIGMISKENGNEFLERTRKLSGRIFNFIKVRKERF